MPAHAPVLAICVNWNGRDVLPDTLRSLLDSDYPELEILVVDNASTDGSAGLVPPQIKILRLPENRGYGAGLNAGIRAATMRERFPLDDREPLADARGSDAHYVLLLNNDIVLEKTAVSRLVECAEKRGAAICGPKILLRDQPDRLEAAWGTVSWSHVLAHYRGKKAKDSARWNEVKEVQLLLGSVLLVSGKIIADVGNFDESFFMYHEEVDFLYRAGKKGYPAYYCPLARVFHKSGYATRETPLQKVFWTRRNAVYFLRKHRAGLHKWLFFYVTLVASLSYHLILFRFRRAILIWRAVREGFKIRVQD